ncbi:MAG TPA: P-loop NTPase fold protein [Solirubrobacteraceae bacterium]|nr:P-loop NTPase fold protein [Solirubrobacteraceae bacterium]
MDQQDGIHRLGLISDRALEPDEEDRFAHDDFVDQLDALVRSGIDTANIALYGSWGAGKSGISRRLAARFKSPEDQQNFRFVELNAFKYADTPLLRTFIYRIAEATVPEKLEHYHRELYEHATKSTLKAPGGWGSTIKVTAALVIALLATVGALLFALPAGAGYHTVRDVVRAIAPSALIVGVLVTVGSKVLPYFTTEGEKLAPASPEQFERLFRDLVHRDLGVNGHDQKRLIVFIDELDRCAPGEVARTLETLRTFVNIPGCIFIVAADQQVLEHALTEHVRQSTPANAINPYYSAGSAYLDKIFEYQMSLPALLPSRLVDFAATLIVGISGVWAELDDVDGVLSVLIPVHVRSPRRVKVLLNRFAMTYAIAKKRSAAGMLDEHLAQRAAELAKLVCIRAEFPLFAAELERDARIIDVIAICLQQDEDDDPSATNERLNAFEPALRLRAEQVTRGDFAVDQLLSEDEDTQDTEESDDEQEASVASDAVRRAHAAQLVDYLRQTELVPGPRQDLVNLESIGATFGADPAFAMDLESAALANQTRRVAELIAVADQEERRAGLLILAALVKRSRGLDARNVMRSLLRACEDAGDRIEDIAPTLVRQLEESGAVVGSDELPGALRLAVLGGSARLTEELMARRELISSEAARHCAIRLSPRLRRYGEKVGSLAGYETERDAAALANLLGEMSDRNAASVVANAATDLDSRLAEALKEAEQETEQPDEEKGSSRVDALLHSINELATTLGSIGHRDASEQSLLALVNLRAQPVRASLDELQDELAPIVSEAVVKALANDLPHRRLSRWRKLLDDLDRTTFVKVVTPELLDRLALRWWKGWRETSDEVMPNIEAAFDVLVEVHANQPTATMEALAEEVKSALAGDFTTEDIDALDHVSRGARLLIEAGLIEAEPARELIVARVGEIAAGHLPETLAPSDQSERLAGILRNAVDGSDGLSLTNCDLAIRESPWLVSPWQELMRVLIDSALPLESRGEALGVAELTALRSEHGPAADVVIASWLAGVGPHVEEALAVLQPWIADRAPTEIRTAIRSYVAALDGDQLTDLAVRLTSDALNRRPSKELLADVSYENADDATVSGAIVALASEASNHDARAVLFDLWEVLKPIDATARKALITGVMIPVAGQGLGAFELVRSKLKVVGDPPRGTKQILVDALLAAAPDEKRRKRMQRRMEELGLRKPRGKRFGLLPR